MVLVYEEVKEEPPSWRPGQRIWTLWKSLWLRDSMPKFAVVTPCHQLLPGPCTKTSDQCISECPDFEGTHRIFHLALGIILPGSFEEQRTGRSSSQRRHWLLVLDQVPPDLCSLQARWYQFRFMMSGTRIGDWGWWDGLAKDMEMGSGWWVGVCEEDNKRKNWGGQKCAATWAEFNKETHL